MLVPVKQIAEISSGHPFRGKIVASGPSGIPVVQIKDLQDGRICWDDIIRAELPGKKKPHRISHGDVLFTAKGTRRYAAAAIDPTLEAICSPQFFHMTPRDLSVVDPEYLAWYLNSKPAQTYFARNAEGTNVRHIRLSLFEQTPIPVPPLEQQRQTVRLAQTIREQNQIHQQLITRNDQLLDAVAQELTQSEDPQS